MPTLAASATNREVGIVGRTEDGFCNSAAREYTKQGAGFCGAFAD
jgi:hypothetical protein